jgi:hypothetical protein
VPGELQFHCKKSKGANRQQGERKAAWAQAPGQQYALFVSGEPKQLKAITGTGKLPASLT